MPPPDYDKMRLEALDRAYMASKLVDKKHFKNMAIAIEHRDGATFKKTCGDAGITDQGLIDHMWEIIDAAYPAVYGLHAPGPIW